ncbi:MAG: FKBP-type peptidyl-prolyl cis-trans isomerase [Acidobacteriia bacterium]|nr:FKBP-type peptidyl-prolyl cis-trans isomerase [Terriglobia bacterium]
MKLIATSLAVVLLLAAPAWAQTPASTAAGVPALDTDEQKALYALGIWLSNQAAPFSLTAAELEYVKAGLIDGILGHEKRVDLQAFRQKLNEMAMSRIAAGEKKAGQAYAEKAAAETGAVKKASGLIYFELKPGTGDSPKATDKVKVNYSGAFIDGTVFDSSDKHGGPAELSLSQMIRCWTEGVQLMKVGGKSKLVCQSDIAYGDTGNPGIKPGATLVFEVELLEIMKPDSGTPAAAKPASAKPGAAKLETAKPETAK